MADTFALDLKRFAEKAGDNARTVVRKVTLDLTTRVVLRTPVGNPSTWKNPPPPGYVGGRLRANWNVSLGAPDLGTGQGPDKSGQRAIARAQAAVSAADAVQPIYIMNSLPYVRRIEYEGWSNQERAGMVRVTVTEFQTLVNQAVTELPK